jgi:uncharacterized cupredoxin-like copper-binding protein
MRAAKFLGALLLTGLLIAPAQADAKEKKSIPVELELSLGLSEPPSDDAFRPKYFELKLGTLYKMTIRNSSRITHYFSAGDMTYGSYTRALELVMPDGKRIVKHRRGIANVKLPPGARAEWTFVATRRRKNMKIYCYLPEHRKKGMTALVAVR